VIAGYMCVEPVHRHTAIVGCLFDDDDDYDIDDFSDEDDVIFV